jgi:Flp pilus assembly protein TadB
VSAVLPLLAGLSIIPPAMALRRHTRGRPTWTPGRPVALAAAALVVALSGVDGVLVAALAGAAWFVRARLRRVRAARVSAAVLTDALPDAVDLAVIAATAGLTVALVVHELARASPEPIRSGVVDALREVDAGRRLADALADLPERLGEPTRPLVAALVASERDGVPLLAALERVGAQVRDERRRAGERAARRLSVTLLFPLVLCILPSFVLLGLVPLLASSLRDLRLP